MRNGVADLVVLALIALASTFITSYFEYKSNNAMAKALYDFNTTKAPQQEEKKYPKIIY